MSNLKEYKTYFIEPTYHEINYIHSENDFLSTHEINKILESVNQNDLYFGKVGAVQTNNNTDHIRRSKICWMKNKDLHWLYEKVGKRILSLNSEKWNFKLSRLDYFQYTEYDETYNGHFDWHLDIGNTCNSTRKLSISIQLSDNNDYEGGELKIRNKNVDKIMTKKKGSLIVFPSYILHKVEPVKKGNRKALIIWFKGEPFQ